MVAAIAIFPLGKWVESRNLAYSIRIGLLHYFTLPFWKLHQQVVNAKSKKELRDRNFKGLLKTLDFEEIGFQVGSFKTFKTSNIFL